MDTSEKYIKMCEQAQEIQNIKKSSFDLGDFASIEGKSFIVPDIPVTCTQFGRKFFISIKKTTWLPRQDQLQEIIIDECVGFIPLGTFERFQIFCDKNWNKFISFEQLWLSFVMKEKYNKIWNEEIQDWEIK